MSRTIKYHRLQLGSFGHSVGHGMDRPLGMEYYSYSRREDLLPVDAGTMFELGFLTPPYGFFNIGFDPYVLYDKWGVALHVWPDEYEPTMEEVKKVIHQFLS